MGGRCQELSTIVATGMKPVGVCGLLSIGATMLVDFHGLFRRYSQDVSRFPLCHSGDPSLYGIGNVADPFTTNIRADALNRDSNSGEPYHIERPDLRTAEQPAAHSVLRARGRATVKP